MEGLHKKSREYFDELKANERDMKTAATELEKLNQQKDFYKTELDDLQKKAAQAGLVLTRSKVTLSDDAKKRDEYVAELKKLKAEIESSKKELDKVSTSFTKFQTEEQTQQEK